jgi:hypothetical protein
LFFFIFYLSHRVISSSSNFPIASYSSSPFSRFLGKSEYSSLPIENTKELSEIKKLFEETQKLWMEIVSSNITLSDKTKEYARLAKVDQKTLKIESLQEKTDKLSNIVFPTSCKNEKATLMKDLQTCREDIEVMKSKSISPPIATVVKSEPISLHRKDQVEREISSVTDNNPSQGLPWLVIGIPTIRRPNNEDYLLDSLETMAKQLPSNPNDIFYGKVLIVVVNIKSSSSSDRHEHFETAKKIYSDRSNSKSVYFEFIDTSEEIPLEDPLKGKKGEFSIGNANVPGMKVRKQTRDLVTVMRKCANKGNYYLFLEDDMKFCPSGFLAIQYLLSK